MGKGRTDETIFPFPRSPPSPSCPEAWPLLSGFGSRGLGLTPVLPLKSFHATGTVHELLLAGEERMAVRADFQMDDVTLVGRARLEGVAASACYRNVVILRMNLFLHETPRSVCQW